MFYNGAIEVAHAQNLVDVDAVCGDRRYRNGEATQLKYESAVEV
jgi:hypothetical protein